MDRPVRSSATGIAEDGSSLSEGVGTGGNSTARGAGWVLRYHKSWSVAVIYSSNAHRAGAEAPTYSSSQCAGPIFGSAPSYHSWAYQNEESNLGSGGWGTRGPCGKGGVRGLVSLGVRANIYGLAAQKS